MILIGVSESGEKYNEFGINSSKIGGDFEKKSPHKIPFNTPISLFAKKCSEVRESTVAIPVGCSCGA
jgi:hypothetical protein